MLPARWGRRARAGRRRLAAGARAAARHLVDTPSAPLLGASCSAAGLTRQLLVAADGARSNDRGVVSVAKLDTGRYQVIFDGDVRACALSATLVEHPPSPADPTAPVTGQIAVAPLPQLKHPRGGVPPE